MPINLTDTLTEAMLSALQGQPTGYTYDEITAWDSVTSAWVTTAVGGAFYTDENTNWVVSSAQVGTDLVFTVDTTPAPNDGGVPGIPWPMKPFRITYTDNDGDTHYSWHQINQEFELEVTNAAPVAVDDTGAVNAGNTVQIDLRPNDSDDVAITDWSIAPGDVPAGWTITETATDGVFDFTVPAGETPGVFNIPYTVTDGGGLTDTADAIVTVAAALGDVYYEARNIVGGETFTWGISSPEGNVTVKKADGTIMGTGATGSFVAPVGDEGETYFVVDDTTIASVWGISNAADDSHALREMHIVNNLVNAVFARDSNNQTHLVYPAGQTYPNMTLTNAQGPVLSNVQFNGDYTNGNVRFNIILGDLLTTAAGLVQTLILPDTSAGGNINTANVRNFDAVTAASFNWRAASGGGDVVGNTLVDFPAGNTYSTQLTFLLSSITGASLPPAAFATVASSGGSQINFAGTTHYGTVANPGGWEITDDANVYHVGHWLTELVAAGRDSTNFSSITELGEWAGDINGYGTTSVYTAAAQAAADALAGTTLPTPPTQWTTASGGEFRL